MASIVSKPKANGRRSILELAPLELDCMNVLWAAGEATVRDIRERLADFRPRAYTTIMTIMDRLAHKGMVARRKSGRAYIYSPHLTVEEARSHALLQLVDGFFAGSTEALRAELDRSGFHGASATQPGKIARELPGVSRSRESVLRREAVETPGPAIDETLL